MKYRIKVLGLFLLIAGLAGLLWGDSLQVKDRMLKRLPQIDQMKLSGAIGENNSGYLEVRAAHPEAQALVGAENADRRAVYEAIAGQQGSSVEAVGRVRAQQIAEKAAAGVWLQDQKGAWYRKK